MLLVYGLLVAKLLHLHLLSELQVPLLQIEVLFLQALHLLLDLLTNG